MTKFVKLDSDVSFAFINIRHIVWIEPLTVGDGAVNEKSRIHFINGASTVIEKSTEEIYSAIYYVLS